jgi:hypothetical protein
MRRTGKKKKKPHKTERQPSRRLSTPPNRCLLMDTPPQRMSFRQWTLPPNRCHSEPGAKPGEEPAVQAGGGRR